MKSFVLCLFICLFAGSAQADVLNSLGVCLFNVTNKLISSELNPELVMNIRMLEERNMIKITRACTVENKASREICQINGLLETFTNLVEEFPSSQKAIDENILENRSRLYLTLFK